MGQVTLVPGALEAVVSKESPRSWPQVHPMQHQEHFANGFGHFYNDASAFTSIDLSPNQLLPFGDPRESQIGIIYPDMDALEESEDFKSDDALCRIGGVTVTVNDFVSPIVMARALTGNIITLSSRADAIYVAVVHGAVNAVVARCAIRDLWHTPFTRRSL